MTVVTRWPFLLTSNPVAPSLSLILSGAGSLQVRVMEVVVRSATARPCGGPVGTGRKKKTDQWSMWKVHRVRKVLSKAIGYDAL